MSGQIALPIFLLRYVSYGAGSAQGAASRRRPLYPRAPASKIAATRSLRLIPAGFGSGRGSVRAKHGPQPASMRAAPAFRERLSDFEAASTGSFSRASGYINNRPLGIMAGTARTPGRVRRQAPPGKNTGAVPDILPGGAALAGPGWGETTGGLCRPDKAFMPPSGTTTGRVPDRPGIPGSLQRLRQIVALHACVGEVGQRHLQLIA